MTNKRTWLKESLEYIEGKGAKEFTRYLIKNKKKSVKAIRLFLTNFGTEVHETKRASFIVAKYVKGDKITKDEEKELRTQVYDIFKAVGLGVPFMLIPGASILLPILVKIATKKGVNLLPSAFNAEEKKSDEPNQSSEEGIVP